jgi:hypothetical protein
MQASDEDDSGDLSASEENSDDEFVDEELPSQELLSPKHKFVDEEKRQERQRDHNEEHHADRQPTGYTPDDKRLRGQSIQQDTIISNNRKSLNFTPSLPVAAGAPRAVGRVVLQAPLGTAAGAPGLPPPHAASLTSAFVTVVQNPMLSTSRLESQVPSLEEAFSKVSCPKRYRMILEEAEQEQLTLLDLVHFGEECNFEVISTLLPSAKKTDVIHLRQFLSNNSQRILASANAPPAVALGNAPFLPTPIPQQQPRHQSTPIIPSSYGQAPAAFSVEVDDLDDRVAEESVEVDDGLDLFDENQERVKAWVRMQQEPAVGIQAPLQAPMQPEEQMEDVKSRTRNKKANMTPEEREGMHSLYF